MLSIRFTYSRLFDLLLLPGALALSACTLPKVLGDSPLDDTTSATAGTTSEPATTTDTGDPPPVCNIAGGGDPGGTLKWSLAGDELPAFFRVAQADDDIVLAGTVVLSDTDRDVVVEVRDAGGASKWARTYSGVHGLHDQTVGAVVDGAGNIHVALREQITAITGEMTGTHDARIVVLRYGPDGALQWRWEQDHPPVPEGSSYSPSAAIGRAGDTIQVLIRAHDEPTVVLGLDPSGAAVSEVELAVPSGLSITEHAFAPDGAAYVGGNLEQPAGQHGLFVGHFALDGSLTWSDHFGSLDDWPTAFVPGPEGDLLMVWSSSLPSGLLTQLRRYDAAGGELWTVELPVTGLDSGVGAGAVRCDGVVLLTGSTAGPPLPDNEWFSQMWLWLGAYTLDGTELWTKTHAFDEEASLGGGGDIAVTLDGDAIVTGSFLADDGATSLPWLGRFAGG